MFGKITAAALLCLALAGCGARHAHVVTPPPAGASFSEMEIRENGSVAGVPSEIISRLQKTLGDELRGDFLLGRGGGLTLEYAVIRYAPGNRLGRWFWGPLSPSSDEGEISVRAVFYDDAGEVVGQIQSRGTVKFGAFGGSVDIAVDNAAKEIAAFASDNFARR